VEHRPRPRVVVLGSGFGGLNAALALARAPVEVTVVDRDNYHGFWPLLYQVATAGLGPEDIAHPLRAIYGRYRNIAVRYESVASIDLERRRVELTGGEHLRYDYAVVALGSAPNDYGIPGVREHAFVLKTVLDAVRLRNHVLRCFEAADADSCARGGGAGGGAPEGDGDGDRDGDGDGDGDGDRDGLLTFVLAGGGPTGVEMAGALAELISRTLTGDYPHLDVTRARVVLVEAAPRLLTGFIDRAHTEALETLRNKGVEVRLGVALAEVAADHVRLADGTVLRARTVVWTAGVRAAAELATLGVPTAPNGTIRVEPDLSVAGHPEVFVVGDGAGCRDRAGRPLPMVAQVAIQGGRHSARSIRRMIDGKAPRRFRYHNHGMMATIGRRDAVAELPGGIYLHGTLGWLAWLVVHLLFLIGFRNRLIVLFNWAWNYLTWDRASRVILEPHE
jgi:NADH dehydrogenase